MLDTLYKYAKFQYECGNYSGAAEYLYFYRVLVSVPLFIFAVCAFASFQILLLSSSEKNPIQSGFALLP